MLIWVSRIATVASGTAAPDWSAKNPVSELVVICDKSFRPLLLSQDGRHGRGVLRGFPRWNFDLSIGKKTTISESVRAVFTFDMINAFNRVEFADPTFNYLNPASFGAITDQFGNPR